MTPLSTDWLNVEHSESCPRSLCVCLTLVRNCKISASHGGNCEECLRMLFGTNVLNYADPKRKCLPGHTT
jgi:hypothetical protein